MSRVDRGAVFLDRDGTLIRALVNDGLPGAVRDHEELELEPGAADACDALVARGFPLVAVTNQPEIARGTQSAAAVERINQRLRELLQLAEIVVCPHDDEDGCPCRKPKPGMLVDAAERHDLDLAASYMVGDRWRDVEAGRRAGCTTVFLNREYSETVPEHPDVTVRTIGEAAAWILAQEKR
jgi:D-glycero-D-manno-heptose 1,7-bisphosphate phosphatase